MSTPDAQRVAADTVRYWAKRCEAAERERDELRSRAAPPEITEEMVERAAHWLYKAGYRDPAWADCAEYTKEVWRRHARAALEAVLGGDHG